MKSEKFSKALADMLICFFTRYVVDFGITSENLLLGDIFVIELNPYEKTTGACLFSWEVKHLGVCVSIHLVFN